LEERRAGLDPPTGTRGPPFVIEPDDLGNNPILQRLRAWDPTAAAETLSFRGELTLVLTPSRFRQTAEFLQGEPGLQFDFLSDISVVDRFPMEPRFELNYHLVSIPNRHTLHLRVSVSSGRDPEIETVTPIWPTADWHEREIFDLFGVRFLGHPDLRRILMPEDWEGHPLRKDYPVEGFR
jgi:NADH-quinone oxidoreductase subunit C